KRMPAVFRQMDIRVSFMQRLPFVFKLFKFYLLLYPLAFESFDLSGYDIILSSSSAWAKGVKKGQGQTHVCYCYTPMRFVWRYDDYVRQESFPDWLKALLPLVIAPLKKWDLQTVAGVDDYIAISSFIAERIKETYGRESVIIYPPVESDLFKPSKLDRDYFLVISRLNAYKRIDLAVEACTKLDLPLKIIGDGPARRNLMMQAGRSVEFLGRQPDSEVVRYLAECRALVFPGEEDFGIVPLEAMSCGRPVIAYRAGGAKETVIEGETGVFFEDQTADSLIAALKRFQFTSFNKDRIRLQARRFDKEIFKQLIKTYLEEKYEGRMR
ncbi:MAG: glycosyltransferase, partial [Candidatus Margulisbacteria bacterium]|nr:glycosyltransferase [Candidatus Margulisiibacteriota bacterium]